MFFTPVDSNFLNQIQISRKAQKLQQAKNRIKKLQQLLAQTEPNPVVNPVAQVQN
jgi:hypothetical protein